MLIDVNGGLIKFYFGWYYLFLEEIDNGIRWL